MSNPGGEAAPMDKKKHPRVRLEPGLEEKALLWSPSKRLSVAKKLERWARQLRISAAILKADQGPKPPPCLKGLHPQKLVLN